MDETPNNMDTLSAAEAEENDQAGEIAKAACGLLTAGGKLLELALKTADAVSSLEPHVTESTASAVVARTIHVSSKSKQCASTGARPGLESQGCPLHRLARTRFYEI